MDSFYRFDFLPASCGELVESIKNLPAPPCPVASFAVVLG